MSSQFTFRSFSILIILGLLAACIPSTAQPTGPSVEEMEAMIATSVALTVSGHETEQATVNSLTPTPMEPSTPTLTATATIVFPTLTPFSSPTHYTTGGGGVSTPSPYSCSVVNKKPTDNTIFKPNKDFDVKFWLRNIGSKKWGAGADLLYDGGTNMLTTAVTYELPEVDPGEMVGPFIFDAKSPYKAGTYVMNFKVQGGFCYPYIKIVVRK